MELMKNRIECPIYQYRKLNAHRVPSKQYTSWGRCWFVIILLESTWILEQHTSCNMFKKD